MESGSTPAAPQMQFITINDDVGPIVNLLGFDMRNGDIANAHSLLIKPTIPTGWHWRPIANLPPSMAMSQTAAHIRVAHAGLLQHRPGNMSDGQLKKAAILTGVARAVTTELYRIESADLIPGEQAPPLLYASVVDGQLTGFNVQHGLPENVTNALTTDLVMSDQEKAVIAAAHMSAIGILPVQGYSLIMTGHHYLSDTATQSNKAFAVMERSNWESAIVKDWWTSDLELNRDALWHKAIHPVNITVKTTAAHSETIANMLKEAGAGPAASRLPALESEMRAANSYKTLLQTVRPMYEEIGGVCNLIVLDEAIYTVGLFPYGVQPAQVVLPSSVPVSVDTREKALKHLSAVLAGNTDTVAHAYGFYCALSDQSQMIAAAAAQDTLKTSYSLKFGQMIAAAAAQDTLKTSYSLKKLKTQSYAAYIAGQQLYGDYTSVKGNQEAGW